MKRSENKGGDEDGYPRAAPRFQQPTKKNAANTNLFSYRGKDADIEYSGNSRVDTGKYVASANLVPADSVNFEVPKISGCTWAINKAMAPVADAVWTDSSEFIYDGEEKTVSIESNLGDAVNVSYSGNTAVNAGRYYAKAVFPRSMMPTLTHLQISAIRGR